MKLLTFTFYIITLINCSTQIDVVNNNNLKNKLSKELAKCLPINWTIWEEYSEENKINLPHIGKGIYDIHIKANYTLIDTVYAENILGKHIHSYNPEIVLHVFNNEEKTRKTVEFVNSNPEVISTNGFEIYFSETMEFIIFEHSLEYQNFEPKDEKVDELRNCLKNKITTYNRMYRK